MKVFIVLVLMVLCNINSPSDGYVTKDARWKTWRYDSDIGNHDNWIGGKMQPDCRGVHFAEENWAPIFLEKMQVEELVLPKTGELWLLDGGFVQFGGKGDDSYVDSNKDYCIKVKPQGYHNWYDWTNWLQEPNNSAVPHQERIPCFYDSVVFPKSYHTRAYIDYYPIYVAQVKYGLATYNEADEFDRLQRTEVGKAAFLNLFIDEQHPIEVSKKVTCSQPEWPCPCHREYVPCVEAEEEQEVLECEKPIQPYGFCTGICGAFLTIELKGEKKRFDLLAKVRKMLEAYESDTHASVVATDYGPNVVQVVFSEKVYRMKSTMEIEDFRRKLLEEKMLLRDYEKSGQVQIEGRTASTVALIFGTLFGVLAMFAILFTVFKDGDAGRFNYFRARFNTSRSFFDPLIFARFDTQNENLIVDGQSLAGSVQNLHHRQSRSFDNPMYAAASSREQLPPEEEEEEEEEKESAPLRSSLLLLHQKSSEGTNEVENPLYDIALKNVNEE